MKRIIDLSNKVKQARTKLKDIGYHVFTDDFEKFAILAERKKIICKNKKEFFDKVDELTNE